MSLNIGFSNKNSDLAGTQCKYRIPIPSEEQKKKKAYVVF